MTVAVEPHLQEAFTQMEKSSRSFFSPSSNPPEFTRGKVNHIAIYPGAFNPPHVAHLRLLQHVLHHHGPELHIVAAMVVPKDVNHIAKKNRDAEEKFAISQDDRCALWEKDTRLPKNTFIWRDSETGTKEFADNLIDVARKADIQVSFVWLLGVEKLETGRDPADWGGIVITSDISRQSKLFPPSKPSRVKGYSEWSLIENEAERKDKPLGSDPFISHASLVWRCEFTKRRRRILYFVGYTGHSQSNVPREEVSSTRIRRLLQGEKGTNLVSAMSEIALSSDLLLKMISDGDVLMDPDQQESIKSSLNQEDRKETG